VAEKVLSIVGGRARLVFQTIPADDPRQRKPDIAQAKAVLDWEPKVDVDTGLVHIVNYFRNLLAS
jgi:UDP-glucuronate decarboxylase